MEASDHDTCQKYVDKVVSVIAKRDTMRKVNYERSMKGNEQ